MDYRNISHAPYSASINFNKRNRYTPRRKFRATTLLFILLYLSLLSALLITPLGNVEAEGIDSRMEPVVLTGANIPDFIGTSVDEIWVYMYTGGSWVQIPFQIDERNDLNGSYFHGAQNGLLDENDEIVFMPFDCGDAATMSTTVLYSDPLRYEIEVTDPLDSSKNYAYIFTSSILQKEFTDDYADYNPTSRTINATDYTLGFDNAIVGIVDELRIDPNIGGDNADLLDQRKFRFQIPTLPFPTQYEEDDFTYELVGFRNGPVRVILQVSFYIKEMDFFVNMKNTLFAYKSYSNSILTMSANTTMDFVRISSDYLGSSIPMTYYDSNMNLLAIDGVSDSPSSTDAPTWTEVTGSHGTIVAVGNISELEGTQFLHYEDDQSAVDPPESEAGQYGNHGIFVNNPTNSSTMYWAYYYLPPNQANIGMTYFNCTQQPMEVSNLSQYVDPSPPPVISSVTSIPDPQEVVGSVNISALISDNLNQLKGSWVDITGPEGEVVGNFTMEYDSSKNRYYYERIFDEVGTYQFVILASDFSGNWNSFSGEFHLIDTQSPSITDLTSVPETQEAGESVNVSVAVSDLLLYGVWVNITDPNGDTVGNFSMTLDPGTGRYYHIGIYDIVGTYEFMISANDTSSNWDFLGGDFEVQDTTGCEIKDVTLLPAPQEINEHVNLSVSIADIVGVHRVWIYITDPDGAIMGNFSMKYDLQTDRYFINQTYDILGTYDYIIWTKDYSSNWNLSSGQFTIRDLTPPSANAGSDQNVFLGTTVSFDGSGSTDNVEVVNFTWTFTDITAQTLYGIGASYTFDNIGVFEITLTVKDASGNSGTDVMKVSVTDIPPGGSISGIVKDEKGNPISNATVRLVGTTYLTLTGENGEFTLWNIPPGTYNLSVEKEGYQGKTISGLTVSSGSNNSLPEESLIMSKEKGEDEGGLGGLWIVIVAVIIIVLLVLFVFARPTIARILKGKGIEGEVGFECPVCGASVISGLTNCPSCGVAFSSEEEAEIVEVSAGEGLEEVEVVYAEKGAEEEIIGEEEEVGVEIAKVEDEIPEEEEPGPSDIYMCPSCGAFISSSAAICNICGFDFEEEEGPVQEEEEEEEEEETYEDYEEESLEIEPTEEEIEKESEMLKEPEEKVEAKEIMQMFKEELKPAESKKELKEDYETLSKEIDAILGESEDEEPGTEGEEEPDESKETGEGKKKERLENELEEE